MLTWSGARRARRARQLSSGGSAVDGAESGAVEGKEGAGRRGRGRRRGSCARNRGVAGR